jgi:hypothetical protein
MGLLRPNVKKNERNEDFAGLIEVQDAFLPKCGKKQWGNGND